MKLKLPAENEQRRCETFSSCRLRRRLRCRIHRRIRISRVGMGWGGRGEDRRHSIHSFKHEGL